MQIPHFRMSFDSHFHFFLTSIVFWKRDPLEPSLIFYGWENFYIKIFIIQFEFLFYAV